MLRRILIALVLVLLVSGAAGAWLWWHMQPSAKGFAYVALDRAPLWDGTGPVRRLLGQLPWGEKLTVLGHYADSTEVRRAGGEIGWAESDDLADPQVWAQLGALAARVRQMTPQAVGHTRVLSNLRLNPGIDSPRIGQLRPNTSVEILARGVAASNSGAEGQPRKQDWLLLRARRQGGGQIAGWSLADFIQDDPPDPLATYATSSGVTPVAWFPLRTVNDPRAGTKPYYLFAGTSAAEGSPCDFTRISVYTWSVVKEQYATAFTEGDLCGRLPLDVAFDSDPRKDVHFRFRNLGPGGEETLAFLMRATIVFPERPARRARARRR